MELSEDQRRAVSCVLAWLKDPEPTMSLGGYAGTGKTTVIGQILSALGRDNVAVCAFTGKAASVLRAKDVDACTMHRLIYQPQTYCEKCEIVVDDEDDAGCPKCAAEMAETNVVEDPSAHLIVRFSRVPLIEAKLVIVDEASMLNQALVHDIESFGVKILYVGDHGQLEPIGDDPGIMADPTIRLEQIHRQAEGSSVIQFAHLVRNGAHPATWTKGGDVEVRMGLERADIASYDAILCGYNRTRVAVNNRVREVRGFSGIPGDGERLICLQNDSELGMFNGMLATVKRLRESSEDFLVLDLEDDAGNLYLKVPVLRSQFGQPQRPDRRVRGLGVFDFGYAMTVHKAQGSEWPRVAVLEQIAPTWNAARWRYTAATRASQTLHYFLSTGAR